MTEEEKSYQLIVAQVLASNPKLEPLLQTLMKDHGLDAYTARTRLTGSGKALFGSGTLEKTSQLANLLRQHDIVCWVIHRSEPAFAPARLRDLEIAQDEIRLVVRDKIISLPRGARVVAILADISGQLEERALKMHVLQSRYKHARHISSMADEKMAESVLKGKPVLDFYLLDEQGHPRQALRVFPGRFNAKGLGERMTLSATRNLEALAQLVSEYAGSFTVHADFGLGRLPGCQIKNLDGKFTDNDQLLKSLTRYGWLMCDLEQDCPAEKAEEIDPVLAAVAMASGQPALAAAVATGNLEAVPGLAEIAREIKAATAEPDEPAEEETADEWLPMPPERPARQLSGRMLLSTIGTFFLVGLLILVSQGDSQLLRSFGRYGMRAGAFPGLVSVGLLWAGFYFMRLKRMIENTPTSRIRSIAMGMVEIHGKAIRKYALVSPMTQSACVYYRLRQYKKDNRNHWDLKSDKDSRHVPFLVDDGTGQVTVDPTGATVRAKTSRSGVPGEATLVFHGVSADDSGEKWVEDVIFEGTSLYVLGFAQPLQEKRKSLRERTVEKLRDLKLDREALHRYDADGDGKISADEWQAARSDAEQLALKEQLNEKKSGKRQQEHAVIGHSPQRGLPFVVSETISEEILVRKYWLASLTFFLLCLLSGGFALYRFFEYIGV